MVTYKIYRNNVPDTLGELVHTGDSLDVTLGGQPHGKHYYKFTATNEFGTSRPSIAYEGVSVAPGGAIGFANGLGKVTLNLGSLTGADTLHLEGRNTDDDPWTETYAGTSTSHDIVAAVGMYNQWRYYGTYGDGFRGDASPVAAYTAPSITPTTLAYSLSGNNVTFTYTGGDGALIAELMTGSTVVGQFASKSLTIAKPAANTTYFVRLRAGFVTVNSSSVTVAVDIGAFTLTVTKNGTTANLSWTVAANALRYDVYKNGVKIGETTTTSYAAANTTANATFFVRAVNGTMTKDSNTVNYAYIISMDLTNIYYTVPAGFTSCYYRLHIADDSGDGGEVGIQKDGVVQHSIIVIGGENSADGTFAVSSGSVLHGWGQVTSGYWTVEITIT